MWNRPDALNAITQLLFTAAFLLAAYSVLHIVVRLPQFSLREVRIESTLERITPAQVEAVVSNELKGGFFTLNLAAARASFEKLPWVRTATLRRVWPDRLEVSLEEHMPLARWGTSALVNTRGEVFGAAHDGKLPLFIGPEKSAAEIAIQYTFFKRTLAAIGEVPTQIRLSARRAWQIRLESGVTLELGRDRIEPRLERFVALYDRTVKPLQRKLDYIDLRYPNGFALRIPELRVETPDKRRGRPPNVKRG